MEDAASKYNKSSKPTSLTKQYFNHWKSLINTKEETNIEEWKSDTVPQTFKQMREKDAIEKQIENPGAMDYPDIDYDNPINDLNTPCIYTLCFPELFYKGAGDPTNKRNRQRYVEPKLAVRHLTKWAYKNTDGKWVWPFQKHPYFQFWAFNRLRRKEILQKTNHYLDKNNEYSDMTVGEVSDLLNKKDKGVVKFLRRSSSSIKGCASWWYKRGCELNSMISQLGCPTAFVTYSFADNHNPDLHRLFGDENADIKIKMQNVRDYPGIVAMFWRLKMRAWWYKRGC
eukprot:193123_1